MEITVVGTGYVGMVAACCLARSGHTVTAVDKDQEKLEQLRQNVLPIYEKDLDYIFWEALRDNRLSFTHDLASSLEQAEIVIVAVGTPAKTDGRIDLSQVYEVASDLAILAKKPLKVVMKSTVPPGFGQSVCERVFSRSKFKIDYVSNPEFLREGKAVQDWYFPDRIVIGCNDQEVSKTVANLYHDLAAPIVFMDVTSAEMVKYASNAFLATKISFINEIANLCERLGTDIDIIAETIGMDKRIGPQFLKAGLGYGGSCFPKDTRGLDYISTSYGHCFSLLKAVIEVNSRQRVLATRKILQALPADNKKVAVLGLAFKPGTNDVREAPALDIIDQLLGEGVEVTACDPIAIENAQKKLPSAVVFNQNPYATCRDCSAVLLATEWEEYVALDWNQIKGVMKPPFFLMDGRNALDPIAIKQAGFRYLGIGRSRNQLVPEY
ncbi:MAG: UDP-glucose/GDP-mannose dehydrogenase family protein [Firmicutes bacterium]|nr:UDP-glucose/GDP-mannose dehydrogenase family protein [Bacillota bacterium]